MSVLVCRQFLVFDEADRLVEKGHFAHLTALLSIIRPSDDVDLEAVRPIPSSVTNDPLQVLPGTPAKRQTLLFSATLGNTGVVNESVGKQHKRGKKGKRDDNVSAVVALMRQVREQRWRCW